jgi:adenosylcobinamide-phosphate synthase
MIAGYCGLILLTATTIAVKDLVDSARAVIGSVGDGALEEARRNLGMIVGRDTARLGENGILKATIETLAENLSDGVVAPLFYFAIGGLPLAMAYKAVNTLDSMVGYRNDRYRYFGWAAARLDDLANFIPARLTGFLIVAAVGLYRMLHAACASHAGAGTALAIMLRDGRKHASPNSGIPEAAMAGGLGVRLGGPSSYGGVVFEKPYIGEEVRTDYLAASHCTISIVRLAATLGLGLAIALLLLRSTL